MNNVFSWSYACLRAEGKYFHYLLSVIKNITYSQYITLKHVDPEYRQIGETAPAVARNCVSDKWW